MKQTQTDTQQSISSSAEALKEKAPYREPLAPVQRQRNDTGLPDGLKSGIENLSGYSMDDVKVHYNSSAPATLQAHAYAQGTDIHVAPGQERHVPHEAWHVVQQKQGRVKPTRQMKGKVPVNDDAGLEHEADVMGAKAMGGKSVPFSVAVQKKQAATTPTVQAVTQLRQVGLFGLEAEVFGNRFRFMTIQGMEDFDIMNDPEVILEEYSLGEVFDSIDISLDNEMIERTGADMVERHYTVEFIQKPIDVLGDGSDVELTSAAWEMVIDLWKNLAKAGAEQTSAVLDKEAPLVSTAGPWEGGQFSKHSASPTVVTEEGEEGEGNKYRFDWKKSLHSVEVDSEDPQVSPQLTAGASLIAAEKVFLATHQGLYKQEPFTKEKAAPMNMKVPDTEEGLAKAEATALAALIRRYTKATRPAPTKTKRYMKEYIPLMVRNSLDAVYRGMSLGGRKQFLRYCIEYLNRKEGNALLTFFGGLQPDAAIFVHTSTKEDSAQSITMEELLFSILKIKKGEEGKLVKDAEAAPGDAFSQAGMAGLSEITGEDDSQLKKYGIDAPDEMMKGVKGVILENRLAKPILLSQMPTLFMEAANSLKLVEELMTAQEVEVV